jgi:hypothetical protein
MLPLVAALAVPPPDTEDARESTASPRTASYTYQSYMLRRERVLSLAAGRRGRGAERGRARSPSASPRGTSPGARLLVGKVANGSRAFYIVFNIQNKMLNGNP